MNFLSIRRILGFSWFYLLAFVTAALLISTDAEVEDLASLLLPPHLPAILLFSIPTALVAVPSLILFRRRRWGLGVVVAIFSGIGFWGVLQILQTTASPLTIGEVVSFLPQVVFILGSWIILVSLPTALLLGLTVDRR